jgi:hypothetical protein
LFATVHVRLRIMAKLTFSLKFSVISFLLFAASLNSLTSSAAVLPDGNRCGYGYPKCPEGYKCARKNNCTIRVHGPRRQSAEICTDGVLDVRTCKTIATSASSLRSSSKDGSSSISSSLAKRTSESTPRQEYTLTYVSQSGTINPTSSGYVTKSSGYASNSNPISQPSSNSNPISQPSSNSNPISRPSSNSNPISRPSSISNPISRPSSASGQTSKRFEELPSTGYTLSNSVNCSSSSQSTATRSTSIPSDPANKFTAVVGVPGKVVERRSIDVLQRDYPDIFNLLVLAFESIQSKNEANDLSYYQISGMQCLPQ